MVTDRRTRTTSIGLIAGGCVVLVSLLAVTGQIVLIAAGVLGAVVLAAAAVSVWRSFAHFICGAMIVRPLLDLAAGPRAAGVGLTDLFGGAVLLVCLVWLWINRADLAGRLHTRLAQSLVALVLVTALSAAGTLHLANATEVVLRVSAGIAVFFVLDLLLHRRQLSLGQLLSVLAFTYLVPLLFPLLGLVGVPVSHDKDGVTALKSVFYLSNNFGHFLVPLVIVAAAWFVKSTGRTRVVAGLVLGIAGVELVLAQTRGAWLAAFVGVLCVGLLLSKRLLLGLAIVAVVAVLFVPAVNSRVVDLAPDADQPRTESSLAWRFGHWEELLPLSMEEPLLGLGPGESALLTGKEPHNDYVRALVELGVLGLATYLWFLYELLAAAGRAIRRAGVTALSRSRSAATGPHASAVTQATVAGLGAYTLAVAVASVAENLIDNVTFLWVLMPCAAMLVSICETRGRVTIDPTVPVPASSKSASAQVVRP